MSTFESVRRGLGQVRDSLVEGWQQLRDRASEGITRFNPVHRGGDVDTREDRVMQRASRWGLVAAELWETDTDIIVSLEAPGMEGEDFDISVVDDHLVVRGEKRVSKERSEGSYHIMECAYGRFERIIALPVSVDDSQAKARYRRGILTIMLPKSQSMARRQINVDSA
jgi:HSP20 family protein